MKYPFRYLARFKIETVGPLSIGAGKTGLLNERLIAKDANNLPYIPGTGLAGIVRHELRKNQTLKDKIDGLFGFQDDEDGQGSRITFSPGLLVKSDNQTVVEGLQLIDWADPFFQIFESLPERDHVRINHRGVAEKHGKFEEQLVHRGTRFLFEVELVGDQQDQESWEAVLEIMSHPSFRIGAGTRNGFGQLQIVECHSHIYRLDQKEALLAYLDKSSSLNSKIQNWPSYDFQHVGDRDWYSYKLELKAEDFFLFGAGLWDDQADNKPKKERVICWKEQGPVLEEKYLIPATSIKGALAHRTAFHFNKLKGRDILTILEEQTSAEFDIDQNLADTFQFSPPIEEMDFSRHARAWKERETEIQAIQVEDFSNWHTYKEELFDQILEGTNLSPELGENNPAVRNLFGFAKSEDLGQRGRVIFEDIYLSSSDKDPVSEKYFNHVSIDRFTGGARAGALFTEKTITTTQDISLEIWVEKNAFKDSQIQTAFEAALDDLTSGLLPLGGSNAKGHGIFKGKWTKN